MRTFVTAATDELEKMKAQFGEPKVASDGSFSWDLGGTPPSGVKLPEACPAAKVPDMTVAPPGEVRHLPPVVLPGRTLRQTHPAVVPLLSVLAATGVLRLLLELFRLVAR
jgi:hypothetical protein